MTRAAVIDITTRLQAATDELRVSGGNQDQIDASIAKLDGILKDYPNDGLGDLPEVDPAPADVDAERMTNAEIIESIGAAPVETPPVPPVETPPETLTPPSE